MRDCCEIKSKTCPTSRKGTCPQDHQEYSEVKVDTILHHLKCPWTHQLKTQRYYFCDSPECEAVYFGEDGSVLTLDDVRHPIGQKQTTKDKLICYCFGVTFGEATQDTTIKDFVIQQTKQGICSCETSNPSGRCCLKDFP